MPQHSVSEIAEHVQGAVDGAADLMIESPAEVRTAAPGQITFIGEGKYAQFWAESKASAVLVSESIKLEPGEGRAAIRVKNADLAMARVLELFAPPVELPEPGIHPTAIIDATATLGEDVRVGPYCVIGKRVTIGAGTMLHGRATIHSDAQVGAGCEFRAGVVIGERCIVGDKCIFHSNVVIGTDGFGYRPEKTEAGVRIVKVPQIGIVRIGSDVELGAGTCVDRAKFDETVIGDGSKLDNMVQIGHNVRLGRMVMISGCTGVAGSVHVGDGVLIGGMASIRDHVNIGAGARIAGGAALIDDVPPGEDWGGMPAKPIKIAIREELAIRKLPDLVKQLKRK